jgi:hypothetical protein
MLLMAIAASACAPSYVSGPHLVNGFGQTVLIADCHRFSDGECVSRGGYIRLAARDETRRLPKPTRGTWGWVVETASGRTLGCTDLRSNATVTKDTRVGLTAGNLRACPTQTH